jgi:hypothetical protein
MHAHPRKKWEHQETEHGLPGHPLPPTTSAPSLKRGGWDSHITEVGLPPSALLFRHTRTPVFLKLPMVAPTLLAPLMHTSVLSRGELVRVKTTLDCHWCISRTPAEMFDLRTSSRTHWPRRRSSPTPAPQSGDVLDPRRKKIAELSGSGRGPPQLHGKYHSTMLPDRPADPEREPGDRHKLQRPRQALRVGQATRLSSP